MSEGRTGKSQENDLGYFALGCTIFFYSCIRLRVALAHVEIQTHTAVGLLAQFAGLGMHFTKLISAVATLVVRCTPAGIGRAVLVTFYLPINLSPVQYFRC